MKFRGQIGSKYRIFWLDCQRNVRNPYGGEERVVGFPTSSPPQAKGDFPFQYCAACNGKWYYFSIPKYPSENGYKPENKTVVTVHLL